jgi:hypothetical protein
MGLNKEQRELKAKLIANAITKDPTLTNLQLAERFGCSSNTICNVRKRVGVPPPLSEFVTQGDLNKSRFVGNVFHTYGSPLSDKIT